MNASAPPTPGPLPFTTPPVLPALDNTFGAVLLGVVIACGLWGINTAQTYWYFIAYAKDSVLLKLLVTIVWSTDTVHQAIITHTVYYYLVTHYFDPLNLDFAVWSLTIQSIFEFLPCFFVQSFFLMRIWTLSRGNWLLIFLPGLLILAKLALSMVWTIKCAALVSVTQGLVEEHSVSAAINGAAAAGDILLATTMVYLLYKSRTGLKQSDSILEKLMLYTVNTGAITSLTSIVTLITAEVWKRAFIYAVFYFCTGRLYANTMLASLNARKSLRAKQGSVIEVSSGFRAASQSHTTGTNSGTAAPFSINSDSEKGSNTKIRSTNLLEELEHYDSSREPV